MIEKNGKSELEQKLLTPASRDNDIQTGVVVVVVSRKDKTSVVNNSRILKEIFRSALMHIVAVLRENNSRALTGNI